MREREREGERERETYRWIYIPGIYIYIFFFTAGDNQVRDRRPINATHKRIVPFEIMQQLPLICFGLQTRYTIDQNRIVVWGQSDLTIVSVKRKARYALVQAVFSSIFSWYCFLSSFVTLLYFIYIYIDNVLCIHCIIKKNFYFFPLYNIYSVAHKFYR